MIIDTATLFQTAAAMMDAVQDMVTAMQDGDTPPMPHGGELDAFAKLVEACHFVVAAVVEETADAEPQEDMYRAALYFNARCGGAVADDDDHDHGCCNQCGGPEGPTGCNSCFKAR